MAVVDLQRVRQARVKIVGRSVIATREEPPRQDAQPPRHLVQPGARRGGRVQALLLRRVTQEGPSLGATRQGRRSTRQLTPRRDQATDIQAPGRLEVIAPPIRTRPPGQVVDHGGQRGSPLRTGAGLAQIPHAMACRAYAGGPYGADALAERRVRAFFWLARLAGRGRRAAGPNRPPRFVISADTEASRWVKAQRQQIERPAMRRLGRAIGIVAGEPGHASMRLEGGLRQEAPEAGAAHGRQPRLEERGDQVVQTPPGGGTMIPGRVPGRHRQDRDARRGGKRAAGAPRAAHPADRCSRGPERADATGQPSGAHRPSRWPRADWMVGLARRFAGSSDSARPRLGEWHGRARATPNGCRPPA